MTGIVAALPEEIGPLLARARHVRRAGRRAWRAEIGREPVCFATTGDGLERAGPGLETMLSKFPIRAVLGVGLAGALSPELAEGEIFAAREVRGPEREAHAADPSWLARAATVADRVGTIVCDGRVRWTAAEKAALLAAHPDARPAASDTESTAWARIARAAGVGFVAIRAILDGADEDLPAHLRDAYRDGAIDRGAIVRHALRHPASVPPLLSLRRRTRRAMTRIADALARLFGERA